MSKRFEVGTDGACRGNPGPGSWAVVGEDGSGSAGARPATTNNIMELTAIREALLDYADMPLRVKSDSTYAVKSALGQWSARLTGSTKNGALIAEVREALAAHPDAELVWVRGHDATNSQPLNTAADALCNESLDRLGVSETYEEYEVGDIVIDWEGSRWGPAATRPRWRRRRSASGRSRRGSTRSCAGQAMPRPDRPGPRRRLWMSPWPSTRANPTTPAPTSSGMRASCWR